MSLDCGESYHGSNRRPSFAMFAIVVTTFDADGLRRNVLETYVSKSYVLVVKNSPCQVDFTVWSQFLTDCTDSLAMLPLVTTESNHVLGLR
jgi:hypothetical protein